MLIYEINALSVVVVCVAVMLFLSSVHYYYDNNGTNSSTVFNDLQNGWSTYVHWLSKYYL